MSLFSLDCDAVSSSIASIESLKSKVSQLYDSVSGYDTSNDEGFNFDGAKSAIASNIQACSIKIDNTVSLINEVIDSHTMLQGTLNFEASEVKGTSSSGKTSTSTSTAAVSGSSSGGTVAAAASTASGAASSYAASASPSGSSSPSPSSSSLSGDSTFATTSTESSSILTDDDDLGDEDVLEAPYQSHKDSENTNKKKKHNDEEEESVVEEEESVVEERHDTSVKNKYTNKNNYKNGQKMEPISSIDCIKVADIHSDKSNEQSSFLSKIEYDNGYAMIGDRYVISCDKSLGDVGDSIIIVKKDGTKINCTIGNVTDTEDSMNSINFVVDGQRWNADNANNVSNGLFGDTSRILVEVDTNDVHATNTNNVPSVNQSTAVNNAPADVSSVVNNDASFSLSSDFKEIHQDSVKGTETFASVIDKASHDVNIVSENTSNSGVEISGKLLGVEPKPLQGTQLKGISSLSGVVGGTSVGGHIAGNISSDGTSDSGDTDELLNMKKCMAYDEARKLHGNIKVYADVNTKNDDGEVEVSD